MTKRVGMDRVTFDPTVLVGRACIRCLRILVALALNLLANGMSLSDIVPEYPDLEPVDIEQARRFSNLKPLSLKL